MGGRIQARIRGVEARIDGFARQLEHYMAQPKGGRKGPALALEAVATYVPWLRTRLEEEVAANTDERSLLSFLQAVVYDLFEASDFIVDWFSDANVQGVPLALFDAVSRECEVLEIGPRSAVLAVGPSDVFNTAAYELGQLLFQGIAAGAQPPDMPDTRFAMIRIPRIEANSSLWWPAVLGHEVAHIKVRQVDPLSRFWLPDREAFKALVIPPDVRKETVQRGHAWVRELVCDAYAIRRFGPAAVSAIIEVLDHRGAVSNYSDSHPPAWLRASVMCHWLAPLLQGSTYSPLLAQAMEIATSAPPPAPPRYKIMFDVLPVLLGMADELMDFVSDWCSSAYDPAARSGFVTAAAADLAHGIPARIERLAADPHSVDADIASAGWVEYLADSLWPVQRLTTKAMDDLALMRRWLEHNGVVEEVSFRSEEDARAAASSEAALSHDAIVRRLNADWGDPEKLVATPLLGEPLGDGSLDVRLGNRFVVFERTETPSFRTLDRQLHGRRVQRRVEVGWGRRFVLHPGELVLASTLEYLLLPGDLAAQVVTRSSYGRMGLICATAVQVHPRYRGCLTLELLNLGVAPLEIAPAERIAQLIFWRVAPAVREDDNPDRTCPTGPEFSRPIPARGDDRVLADILAAEDKRDHADN